MYVASEYSNKFSALTVAPSLYRSTLSWIDINFGVAKDMNVKLFTISIVINIHIQQYITVPSVTYLTNKVYFRKTCIKTSIITASQPPLNAYADTSNAAMATPKLRLLAFRPAPFTTEKRYRENTQTQFPETERAACSSSISFPCTLIFANFSNKVLNSPEL